MSSTSKDINVAEEFDPLVSLTGKLVWGRLANGKTFVSRLIKVDRSKLYFRTKTGLIIMTDLKKIVELMEYVPKRESV